MAVQSYIFPNITPSLAGFNVITPTEMNINGINGVEHITENSGERWHVELQFNFLRRDEAKDLEGHLMSLRGSTNISLIKDLGFVQRGLWPGTIRVNGANEHGLEVAVDGLATFTEIAAPCDRIKIGDRVHSLVSGLRTTSSTSANLQLANEIINIPADNTQIITDPDLLDIRCRWLRPDELRQFRGNKSFFRNIRLTFIESLG
jgi:hypothetical protein